MSFSSPSPSRPASSFGEMQNATSNNNTNNSKSTRLRKSIRANDNIAGSNIMASSPLLGMFSADGKAPSLRNRNGTSYINSNNNNNSIASEERKNSSYGANKVSSEALFQYYAVKGNFEIMHADEFSDGVIDSCLASATPPLPPLLSTTETKSEQGVEGENVNTINNNNNKSDEHASSTSAAAEVEKGNANSISVMIDNDLNKADSDSCHLYNSLRPAQANDVIVKVAARKQIEEQEKNAAAQLRLSMMTLPPLCSYYYNLYKGDAANASLVNEIQTGLVHEAERVEKEVAKHKREVASHSSNASTTRSKEMNKTRLTNTNTQSSINPLPNWNQSPKTLSPTSTLNYTYSNNNINNNNNNNNTFNNSASTSSMMLMGATNTNTNTNNIIPAPPPIPTSASSARSVSAQGNHHLPYQTHQRNSITLNADNLPFSPSTENIFTNHGEKEFNNLLELHAKRMELLNKLESAFAKMKAEVSAGNNTNNAEFNKTNTFTRLSMTAASTNQVTTHETNKKDGKGNKKTSKKRKTGKHEEKPSNIPINLTYFINALLPFTDRAGRVSLRVVECAFHSAPFEVHSNAQNEAVRTLFYWIINHSQAMHDHAATGYDASRGGTEEETDSSGFASGVNINVHNSISLRNNTMMNNTITTTTNSSNSNEERNKSISRMNKPNSHVNSPSNSISINRPSGISRDVSRAMTGSMENKNMMVSAAAGAMTYNSISGTLRQQSNNIFSKSVKQHALEQYIYLHELIAALDGLINSKETGKIARFQCFQALVLNSNGNHYIHRAWLDKIRIEQKQLSHVNHKNASTASTHKNKTDNMESTSSASMKMKISEGSNSKSAWTPSLVAALNCAFDAIAQNEEAEYIKLMSKRSKRRGKGKDSKSSNNTKASEAAQKSSANAKSGSPSSPSSATLSSGAMSGTANNTTNSVIPLNVMRRCHFNFDEFDKWFDTLPMLAASLLPIWLPLLIGTLHLSNVMNSEADHGSHGHNNMDNDTDDDDHVVNGDDSKDVSVMESSSARLHLNKTKPESSLSLSLSRKNDVSTADATAAAGTITDTNNAESSFAHSQGDDMSKSKADNNTNITKIKNTMVPSSGQSGALQSAHEKRSDAPGAIAEGEMGIYPLTLLGEDEMARHAFFKELIKERIAHMNDYVV